MSEVGGLTPANKVTDMQFSNQNNNDEINEEEKEVTDDEDDDDSDSNFMENMSQLIYLEDLGQQ
jgi:hypothetical protein